MKNPAILKSFPTCRVLLIIGDNEVVMNIQTLISTGVSQLAGLLHVGYAFGAGMVSAVNPCGFAMLPVYLSLYLGAEDEQFHQRSWVVRLSKAMAVALVVSSGYGLLFGVIGLVVSAGGTYLMSLMPWISVFIGLGLIFVGVWMFFGKHISFSIFMRIGAGIGDPRTISIRGFFLFGVAFGASSLSCTLPIFLVVVGGSIAAGDVVVGLSQFFWYIMGTASVFMALTVSMAFVKGPVVINALKRFSQYINKISALLLLMAGSYICYYWWTSGLLIE